uniref:Uncharacterized protein n=1 Tax=Steinernema glaseri TaxID=37863 RepID=A0A1I7ZV63_9BILA
MPQSPQKGGVRVLQGVNDVHEYEHELLETYSQSSGSLSYDSYNPIDREIAAKIRLVALKGSTFENLARRTVDERLCLKTGESPPIVPVSAAALRELNRRHVRKPLHRIEQRMRVTIPGDSEGGPAKNDLLELYDKTIAHYCASPMKNHKAFRLEVVCSIPNTRPSQFRMDLIALQETPREKRTIPGAYKSVEDIKAFTAAETISQIDVSSFQSKASMRKLRREHKKKVAERLREEAKMLRGSSSIYPENTAFGGMNAEKHIANVLNTSTKHNFKLFK